MTDEDGDGGTLDRGAGAVSWSGAASVAGSSHPRMKIGMIHTFLKYFIGGREQFRMTEILLD